ncbi:TnsD family Tn7-like transposition protein [Bacillus sp. FJAT-53711]|uniref:TnsD family Tn7-like transposition protein n=1 Tax=Bacillus yunxiaonensis TaxID=3127665 RepID=A0ABU8FPS5_9BACI
MYENELMYSVFARYHVRTGHTAYRQTVFELIDKKGIRIHAGIPANLIYLHEKVSGLFEVGKLEEWIENYTLYNYISNFAKNTVRDNLLEVMRGNLKMNSINVQKLYSNEKFRYCPKCIVEDYEKYGETYWRRDQQLIGVFICLKHQELLRHSDVLWNPFFKGDSYKLEQANLENCPLERESVYKVNNNTLEWLIKIAEECTKVAKSSIPIDFEEIPTIYRYLLRRKGYISGNAVSSELLYRDFKEFYGEDTLHFLKADFDETKRSNWLYIITKKIQQTFHPLKHVLLILFLDENIDTFYKYSNTPINPFGNPPYVCLNPFSSHYLQPVIQETRLRVYKGQELGYFECSCGFKFTRKVGDTQVRVFQIKDVGPWRNDFERLHKIVKVVLNIKEYTQYYNLYRRYMDYTSGQKLKGARKDLDYYKARWLAAMKKYPNHSISSLRNESYSKEFSLLFRHCPEWLKENCPNVNNRGIRPINWGERDKKILNEVKIAVQNVLNQKKPQRITINRLNREILESGKIDRRYLQYLPKTRCYLDSILESVEQFQIRKINHVLKELIKRGTKITYYNVRRAANINQDYISEGAHEKIIEIVNSYNL